MGFVRAADFRNAFADESLCHDELRLARRRSLGFLENVQNLAKIVPVNLVNVPSVGLDSEPQYLRFESPAPSHRG